MGDFGKLLMTLGIVMFLVGLCWPLIGRLPGDFIFKKGHVTFVFPVVTCIMISVVLSLILYLIRRFFN
ncbi:DUF2905 domain-containing protein [Sporolactobacillus sp. CPB3-1]|uniref:DUF2905 domain-containing protein n=1 Tax=Sporolactobacillus mangiferae TaxID=2940498 RepID=A0ABT0M6L2_9BACL|nr:DUF2905 domain-containing protein [Sporolactobacillus mangiferae]MCL1630496.1 DUF2905 domain-containing protein [Sporolactobacillus mangiferae]